MASELSEKWRNTGLVGQKVSFFSGGFFLFSFKLFFVELLRSLFFPFFRLLLIAWRGAPSRGR